MGHVNKFTGIWKILKSLKINKKSNNQNFFFKDYFIDFYFRPEDPLILKNIFENISIVNRESARDLKIGILKSENDFYRMANNIAISIFYLKEKPVGFFYNYIYKRENGECVVYQGTFLSNSNVGVDIISIAGLLNSILIYQKIGNYYISALSRVPAVLEVIANNTTSPWPDPRSNNERPPKKYKEIFVESLDNFKELFLDDNEAFEIIDRKFVLRFTSSNDFGSSIHDYKLAKDSRYNLFLNFWLDFSKKDMLFLVTQFDSKNYKKNKNSLLKIIYYYYFKS